MNLFLSKYLNNIDKKGRTSIPAQYRQIVSSEGFASIVVYPSIRNKCLEASGIGRINELSEMIHKLDPYSDERDAFETIILGEATQLLFDPEGRVLLPKHLIDHARLEHNAIFVGKGKIFEIWNPELFEGHLGRLKQIAAENKTMLKNIQNEVTGS